ncbi:MAG: hypothetical protein WB764_10275 [Xanthobacteraceae bacterium]
MREMLSDTQVKYVATLVKSAMMAKQLTATKVAKLAGYSDKVVRELLKGYAKPRNTVSEICAALTIDLDCVLRDAGIENGNTTEESAPTECGGYSRKNYGHYIGAYTTIRPAYADPRILKCYRTDLSWDDSLSRLRFTELHRDDEYGQNGHVYIAPGSAHLYLLTINRGWVRTVLVSQLVNNNRIMRGLILSQFNSGGASYAPVSAPIVYIKQSDAERGTTYGEITSESEHFARYLGLVRETVQRSFVRIVQPI